MKQLVPLLLFLLLIVPSALQAQFRLGAEYYGNFSSTNDDFLDTDARFSHTAGLHLSYPLSSHLRLSFGIAYANLGDQLVRRDLMWGNQHNGNGGFDPSQDTEIDLTTIRAFEFAETPIRLTYRSKPGKRLSFYGTAGLAPRFLLRARDIYVIDYADGSTARSVSESIDDWNTLQWSGLAAAGIEYGLSERFLIYAGPRAQYHQQRGQSPAGAAIKANYWQFGLETGIRFR